MSSTPIDPEAKKKRRKARKKTKTENGNNNKPPKPKNDFQVSKRGTLTSQMTWLQSGLPVGLFDILQTKYDLIADKNYIALQTFFVDQPILSSEAMVCSSCDELYDDPIEMTCGHMFCCACIEDEKNCPECNVELPPTGATKQYRVTDFYSKINSLEIKCPLGDCDWRGKYASLSSHVTLKCDFMPDQCPHIGCPAKVVRMQKDIHAVLCPQKAINKAERRRARQAMLDRKLGNGPPPPVPARPRESIDELPVEDIVTLGWKLQQQSELNGLSPPTSPRRPPRATDTTTTTDAVDEKGAAQANDAALLAKLEMSQANADEAAARHAEQRQYRMSMRVDELVAGIGTDEMLLKENLPEEHRVRVEEHLLEQTRELAPLRARMSVILTKSDITTYHESLKKRSSVNKKDNNEEEEEEDDDDDDDDDDVALDYSDKSSSSDKSTRQLHDVMRRAVSVDDEHTRRHAAELHRKLSHHAGLIVEELSDTTSNDVSLSDSGEIPVLVRFVAPPPPLPKSAPPPLRAALTRPDSPASSPPRSTTVRARSHSSSIAGSSPNSNNSSPRGLYAAAFAAAKQTSSADLTSLMTPDGSPDPNSPFSSSITKSLSLMKSISVPLSTSAKSSPYAPLIQLLPGSSLLFVNALCVAIGREQEKFILESALCALDAHSMLKFTLEGGIAAEVLSTTSSAQLFRANSACAKLVSAFVRREGTPTLRAIMRPLIGELTALDSVFEVDPSKPDYSPTSAVALECLAVRIMSAIEKASTWSPAVRWIAATLRDCCAAKFDESGGAAAVAGCLFLRFVCPALTLPVDRGIARFQPTAHVSRTLLLLSKLLQSLANGAVSKKEPYMEIFAPFIRKQSSELSRLYNSFCKVNPSAIETSLGLCDQDTAESLHLPLIHGTVEEHWTGVEKSLLAYKQHDTLEALSSVRDKLPTPTDPLSVLTKRAQEQSIKQQSTAAARVAPTPPTTPGRGSTPNTPGRSTPPSSPSRKASLTAATAAAAAAAAAPSSPPPSSPPPKIPNRSPPRSRRSTGKHRSSSLSQSSTAMEQAVAAHAEAEAKPLSSLLHSLKSAVNVVSSVEDKDEKKSTLATRSNEPTQTNKPVVPARPRSASTSPLSRSPVRRPLPVVPARKSSQTPPLEDETRQKTPANESEDDEGDYDETMSPRDASQSKYFVVIEEVPPTDGFLKLNVGDCVLIADRPAAAPELFRAVTRKGRKGWVPRKALRVARKAERDALKHALKERMKAREDRKNTLAAAAVADSTAAD